MMVRLQRRCSLAALIALLALLAPLSFAETHYVEKYPIFETYEGPYSYAEIDKKDYSGITLKVVTMEPPVMGGPALRHAAQFEELTGAKVEVKGVPIGDLYKTVMMPFLQGKGEYDCILFSPNWSADVMGGGYLEPIPEKMLQSKQWNDVIDGYKFLQAWEGGIFGIPIDGDKHLLSYRKDALENPEYQQKFKTQYGYDLRPPQTWDEYRDMAEFFNGWDWDSDGEIEYGTAEMTKAEALMFWQYIVRAAPYAKHPAVKGGFFFDVETMKPLINTPGFVQALEDIIAIREFYPPGGDEWDLADVTESFGSGQTAFQVNWDNGFIKAMEADSPIRNKVSTAMAPGAEKVWNRKTETWDEFPDVNYVGYLAWGGWITGVPKTSLHKEAAFDFLGFFSNPANQRSDLTVGGFGVNPYRVTDFDEAFWVNKAGFSPEIAKAYIDTIQKTMFHSNKLYDLLIPGNQLYVTVLSKAVDDAVKGKVPPQEALDRAAKEWEKLTRRFGLDRQQAAYRRVDSAALDAGWEYRRHTQRRTRICVDTLDQNLTDARGGICE